MLRSKRTTVASKLLVTLNLPSGGEEGVGLPVASAGSRLAKANESLASGLLRLEGDEGLKPGDGLADRDNGSIERLLERVG